MSVSLAALVLTKMCWVVLCWVMLCQGGWHCSKRAEAVAVGTSCLVCFLPKAVMNCLKITSLGPNFSCSLHEAAALQPW